MKDALKKSKPPSASWGARSWKSKAGPAAAALFATLLSLGGTALLFAVSSGELGEALAWLKSSAPARALAGDPPTRSAPG